MIYEAEQGRVTLALWGDIMLAGWPSSANQDSWDCAKFCKAPMPDSPIWKAWSSATSKERPRYAPTHMVTEPELLEDIKWFGFNMLSCANDHWLNSAKKVCCKTATWKYPNPSAPASNGGTAWVSFAPRKR